MNTLEAVYQRAPVWLQSLLMNGHAWRIERHRYGAPFRDAVKRLATMEQWDEERIRAYQDERIRHVVQTAYERSPYYRESMRAAGVHPAEIRGAQDLARLPLLTKDIVRSRGVDLQTSRTPAPGWHAGHTSGTTGTPLAMWYDQTTCVMTNAVDRRHKQWVGLGDDDWIGLLLGRVIVPAHQQRPPFWRTNHIQKQVWFSSFHLSEEHMASYVREIQRRRLRFLEGYPSTLFILAKYVLQRGIELPMDAVITSSETLHEVQRQTIEAAFDCKLFDFYALAERVIYAGECEAHVGKHLAETYGYAEVVDEDGDPVPDGGCGYLVGTSLHNLAMPMIRYRTSDVSRIMTETCACGKSLRRIQDVTTKAEDIVVTPDGRMISPSVLTHPFKPLEHIAASQIVQERLDHLVVKLVAADQPSREEEHALLQSLRDRLGDDMTIEIRNVSTIPRDPSGKLRWVVSKVPHSYLVPWATDERRLESIERTAAPV